MRAPDEPAALLRFLTGLRAGEECTLRVPLDVTEERLLAELGRRVPRQRFTLRDVSVEWARTMAELPPPPHGPARPTPEGLATLVLALQSHYARAHPGPDGGEGDEARPSLAAALGPALRADRVRVFGDAGLVAWTLDAQAPGEGGVLFVGVRPQARGQGVGAALQLAALHGLRRDGASLARGAARAGNGAMNRLFGRLGYREEALLYDLRAEPAEPWRDPVAIP